MCSPVSELLGLGLFLCAQVTGGTLKARAGTHAVGEETRAQYEGEQVGDPCSEARPGRGRGAEGRGCRRPPALGAPG